LCQELQDLAGKGMGRLPNLTKLKIININEPKSELLVTLLKESMPHEVDELTIGCNMFPKFMRPWAFYRKIFYSILPNVKKEIGFSSFTIRSNDLNNTIIKSAHLEAICFRNFIFDLKEDLNFDETIDYKTTTLYFAFSKNKDAPSDFNETWLARVLKAIKETTLVDTLEKITVQTCNVNNDDAQALLEELELDSIDLKISED
jgi:hypothetical protein